MSVGYVQCSNERDGCVPLSQVAGRGAGPAKKWGGRRSSLGANPPYLVGNTTAYCVHLRQKSRRADVLTRVREDVGGGGRAKN